MSKPDSSVSARIGICSVCNIQRHLVSDLDICRDCYKPYLNNYVAQLNQTIQNWMASNPIPIAKCEKCGREINPLQGDNPWGIDYYLTCGYCDSEKYGYGRVHYTNGKKYVYFAHLDGYIKIGYSKNPKRRAYALKMEIFNKLHLDYAEFAERFFHNMFWVDRIGSREIFNINQDAVEWLANLHVIDGQVVDYFGDTIWKPSYANLAGGIKK